MNQTRIKPAIPKRIVIIRSAGNCSIPILARVNPKPQVIGTIRANKICLEFIVIHTKKKEVNYDLLLITEYFYFSYLDFVKRPIAKRAAIAVLIQSIAAPGAA